MSVQLGYLAIPPHSGIILMEHIMSIGTSHIFNALTKDSKALPEQRLVRLIAKGKNKSANLSESMCVSVPVLTQEHVIDKIDQLMPYVVGWLQDVQDKVIREYRVTSGASEVHESIFDVDHCVEYLANSGNGKFTKEYMQEWFMEDYGDVAREWIIARFGTLGKTNVSDNVITSKVNVLRDVIAGWSAGGRYKPSLPQCKMMAAFAGDVECDGIMSSVKSMSEARIVVLEQELNEDSLGF